eukprot:Skav221595  [mRNA]  locus=scaffold1698:356642:357124:+ [translate_table: standard]
MNAELRALRSDLAGLTAEVANLRQEVVDLRQSSSGTTPATASYPAGGAGAAATGPLTWEDRLAIASQIGKYLERADRGNHRGESGRSLVPLASRYWIVIRDFNGERFNPVRVFNRWAGAKSLVKRGDQVGESVFVGLPSEREVRAVLLSGGFRGEGRIEQ